MVGVCRPFRFSFPCRHTPFPFMRRSEDDCKSILKLVQRLLTILGIPHLEYTLIHAVVQMDGKEYETHLCGSYGKLPNPYIHQGKNRI